ncbi:MAG: hypothetical protein J0M24_19215 [Verrucomicrobia bacterium]|nr:hypothetical protein [Verrucomicrobiota bacterium]
MKSRLLKLVSMVALVSSALSTSKADFVSTVTGLNPLAYWQLDESTPLPPADVASNLGSVGSPANAFYLGLASHPVTGALAGSTDSAAYFDGTAGSYALVPYLPALHPAAPFTVEAWLNPGTSFDAGSGTLTCALSAGQFASPRTGWLIYQSETGWNLRMYDNKGTATSLSITGGGAPTPGLWYHVVAVYDGTVAKLYVNGQMAAEGTPTGYVPGASGGLAIAGRADASFYWNGSADEVALYPTALSAAQISAHFANGTSATPTTPYNSLVLASAPLAYYRLGESAYTPPSSLPVAKNQGSIGAAADGSFNPGMTVAVEGPRPPAFSGFDPSNLAGRFNGAAGYVGTQFTLNDLTEFTLSGWVRRGAIHSGRGGYFGQNDLLEFGDANSGASVELYVNARAGNIIANYPFRDDEWGLFTVVASPTNTVLYANGLEIGRMTGPVESYGSSAYTFNIGGGGIFNTAGDFFLGDIDEVAVFPTALTAEQVQQLYFTSEVAPVITRQPALPSRPLYAGYTLALSVAARGSDPVSFQWRRAGVDLNTQTNASLEIPSMTEALAGLYDVVVSNPYGSATSAPVSVSVLPADGIAPVIQYAAGLPSFTQARIWFSKPLDPVTAQNPSSYQIPGLTVTAAALAASPGLEGDNIVVLTTSPQTPGQTYTVTVTGIKDQMLPASTIAAGASISFGSWVLAQGILRFEHYDNLPAANDAAITAALSDSRVVAGKPTTLGNLVGRFDTRTFFADDSHENYFAQMSGFITPTESGDYYFFVSSDDASRVYLSSNETPPNPAVDAPIIFELDCCAGYAEPDAGDAATTATPISLVAGRKYAILALLKEGGGGDYLRVAWRKSTDSTAATALPPIPGEFFASYVDPNAEIAFSLQPTDELAAPLSVPVAFTNVSFATSGGGFTVTNTTPEPPGPFLYDSGSGTWTADGSSEGCDGPYNSRLISPEFVVPASQAVMISLTHRYSFESDYWDGGQILVSTNGGPFVLVPKENFVSNGYATGRTIQGGGVINGQYAFNGDSAGYAAGEFITTTAVLGVFAAGDRVAVQFLGAWDDCSRASLPSWAIKSFTLSTIDPPTRVTFDSEAVVTRQGTPTTFTYQWQRDSGSGFVDLPNEIGSDLSFFAIQPADFESDYRVVVGVPGRFVTSEVVNVVTATTTPTVAISATGDSITIIYTGTLQSAPSLAGPFTSVVGATSPFTTTAVGTTFYRAVP